MCVEGRLELTRTLLGDDAPENVRLFDKLRVDICVALHKKYWLKNKKELGPYPY